MSSKKFGSILDASQEDIGSDIADMFNSDFEEEVVPMDNSSEDEFCLLYTSPSPRDGLLSRMPSSA